MRTNFSIISVYLQTGTKGDWVLGFYKVREKGTVNRYRLNVREIGFAGPCNFFGSFSTNKYGQIRSQLKLLFIIICLLFSLDQF